MTPAIKLIKNNKILFNIHEYHHAQTAQSYGLEAAEKLAVIEQRIFKTLVVLLDNKELVVAVIAVSSKLSLKYMAKVLGGKKVVMANQAAVERSTGYVLGGVSPLGQKKILKTVIDLSAKNYSTIYVSAGKRGLEIELAAADLCELSNGQFAKITQ
ncbi:MAG: Cys-tRNA(Pro) deacylase [Saccharospirillaceae bacterium]|nr:Cys-tRNA(Pro) deacylase [Pseudomonadales bacterium]NRB81296.1 Cys-tRNA(Pro) deacylase [Saccharospirillaceae bacterium]